MNSAERAYSVTEQELLALVAMVETHAVYLTGDVTAKVDHRPLVWLNKQQHLSSRQVRWVQKLQEFNIKIEYIPGKTNVLADFLSRQPLLQPKCHTCHKRFDEQEIQVISVEDPAEQTVIINHYHDTPEAGHQGISRTLEKIQRHFTWPTQILDVQKYVKSCTECQQAKPRNSKPDGLLHSVPTPTTRFHTVGMDWFSMPCTKDGVDMIFIIVDYLTKLTRLIPCSSKNTAKDLALLFKTHWHDIGLGLPSVIISDRDKWLTSKFWRNLCQTLHITQQLSTARHQQTNGQVERTIRTIKTSMLPLINYKKTNWPSLLSALEFAHNDSISASTGSTPFFLTYNQHPHSVLSSEHNLPWYTAVQKARDAIEKAHQAQAKIYNRNRQDSDIQAQDLVLLAREGIQWSPDSQRSKKLLTPWLGPFRVLERSGQNATLELPSHCKIHPTFSISKLKKFIPRGDSVPAPTHWVNGNEEFEVDKILDHRTWYGHVQYLVSWKHANESKNQWLFAEDMNNCTTLIQAYLSSRGGVREVDESRPSDRRPFPKVRLRLSSAPMDINRQC